MRTNTFGRLLGTLLGVILASGCTYSTEYRPKSRGRAYLVVEDNRYALVKNGHVAPAGSPEMVHLVLCDPRARDRALEALKDQPGAGQPAPLVVKTTYGFSRRERVAARTIDAINLHNDSPSCSEPTTRPSVRSAP